MYLYSDEIPYGTLPSGNLDFSKCHQFVIVATSDKTVYEKSVLKIEGWKRFYFVKDGKVYDAVLPPCHPYFRRNELEVKYERQFSIGGEYSKDDLYIVERMDAIYHTGNEGRIICPMKNDRIYSPSGYGDTIKEWVIINSTYNSDVDDDNDKTLRLTANATCAGTSINASIFDEFSHSMFDGTPIRNDLKIDIESPHITYHYTPKPEIITFSIDTVIYNKPATIIKWKDGSKTVVKCGKNDEYDPEKGFVMAVIKKMLGNKGNYYNTIRQWLPTDMKFENVSEVTVKQDCKGKQEVAVSIKNIPHNEETATETKGDKNGKRHRRKVEKVEEAKEE